MSGTEEQREYYERIEFDVVQLTREQAEYIRFYIDLLHYEADGLRELVRDMWTCIQTADKSDNAWDECPRCSLWNGNNNHRCNFDRRMKELGVEV